jgi:hypothetical protein
MALTDTNLGGEITENDVSIYKVRHQTRTESYYFLFSKNQIQKQKRLPVSNKKRILCLVDIDDGGIELSYALCLPSDGLI